MRVALVTNFATHYRLPVFRMLGESLDVDYFFTGAGFKRYWSPLHSIETEGLRVVPTRSSAGLAWALGKGDYDCHVIAVAGRLKLIAALAAAAFLRRPTVLWVGIWEHPRTLFHRMTRPLLAILYRKADALVVYGPHVAAHVAAESGRTAGVSVVRQAVDNERFRTASDDDRVRARARMPPTPFVALFVGRLEQEKGLESLLAAVSTAPPDVGLALVGSGSRERRLRELADRHGLGSRVAFLGYVEQADLPAYLHAGDALVLPSVSTRSFRETWGLVVNEAMNAGLPVVTTTAVGAVPGGLVEDGLTGLVVAERDTAGLAEALIALAADDALRTRLGDAGRERVLEWSFDAAASALRSAIVAAVEHRRVTRR